MRASVLILVVPAGFAAYGGYLYYQLLWLRVQGRQALQHVDDQLGKHHDTIPHLLLTISEYVQHEAWIIEHVMEARYRAVAAATVHERMAASAHLSQALHKLLAISSTCVELHGNDEAALIHMEVVLGEQKIALAREYYNQVVHHYNRRIDQFPHRLLARIGGLRKQSLFETPDRSRRDLVGADASFG